MWRNAIIHNALFILIGICWCLTSCTRENESQRDGMIDIGTHRLQIRLAGSGTPCVVIDAGLGDSFDKWTAIQDSIAVVTQVVTYNRAGYGISESGPKPRDGNREAEELKLLLEKASISGPYLLVGHSLGALNVQVFASKYPDQVAGIVLLDSPPLPFILSQEYQDLKRMAEQMTHEWQIMADSLEKSENTQEQSLSVFFEMIASEHREMFGATAETVNSISSFGDIPLTVIAADQANPAFGEFAESFQEFWVNQSRKLSEKSSSGTFILAEESSHQLYLDEPELVVETIISIVKEVREE